LYIILNITVNSFVHYLHKVQNMRSLLPTASFISETTGYFSIKIDVAEPALNVFGRILKNQIIVHKILKQEKISHEVLRRYRYCYYSEY